MKTIFTSALLCTLGAAYAQNVYGPQANSALGSTAATLNYSVQNVNETCNTSVINDTDEQNGVFISGSSGQKAAADIPLSAGQQITITGMRVTLTSLAVPTYAHLRFYGTTMSEPNEEDEIPSQAVPGEPLFDVEDTSLGEFVEIAYISSNNMYVRDFELNLATPVTLNGSETDGRYWLGILSDAKAWASTAHFDTGEDVVGYPVTMGGNNFDWFQLNNIEVLYDIYAECSLLGLNSLNQGAATVAPNPVKDMLTITVPGNAAIIKTEIYNMAGQRVAGQGPGFAIAVSALSAGTYIVKTYTDNHFVYSDRFIKQ